MTPPRPRYSSLNIPAVLHAFPLRLSPTFRILPPPGLHEVVIKSHGLSPPSQTVPNLRHRLGSLPPRLLEFFIVSMAKETSLYYFYTYFSL